MAFILANFLFGPILHRRVRLAATTFRAFRMLRILMDFISTLFFYWFGMNRPFTAEIYNKRDQARKEVRKEL